MFLNSVAVNEGEGRSSSEVQRPNTTIVPTKPFSGHGLLSEEPSAYADMEDFRREDEEADRSEEAKEKGERGALVIGQRTN